MKLPPLPPSRVPDKKSEMNISTLPLAPADNAQAHSRKVRNTPAVAENDNSNQKTLSDMKNLERNNWKYILSQQPDLHSISRSVFLNKLASDFPALPQPVDPEKIFVIQYVDSPDKKDENGQPERSIVSKRTLMDVYKDVLSGGSVPVYDAGTTGIYPSQDAIADEDKLPVDPQSLMLTLAESRSDSLTRFSGETDNFWKQNNGVNIKIQSGYMAAQRRYEGALRTADGTLPPEAKQLLDRFLDSNGSAPSSNPPGTFSLTVHDESNSVGFDLRGPLVITSSPAESPESTAGPVLMLLPGRGMMAYASGEEYAASMNEVSENQQLMSHFLEYFPAGAPGAELPAGEPAPVNFFSHTAIKTPAFEHSFRGLLSLQDDDIRSSQSAAEAGEAAADFTGWFSSESILETRDRNLIGKLIADAEPDWLKNADPTVRAEYDELRSKVNESTEKLKTALKVVLPSLEHYARTRISDALGVRWPGRDIDPDKTWVTMTTVTRTYIGGQGIGQSVSESKTQKMTLTQAMLLNQEPWQVTPGTWRETRMSAPLINSSGKPVQDDTGAALTLGKAQIDALAQELDVAGGYSSLMKAEIADPSSAVRKEWKNANADVMRLHLFETENNPEAMATFVWQSSEEPYGRRRGLQYIDAVLNYPDPESRPVVDGKPVYLDQLVLGASTDAGRGGQNIRGVMLAGTRDGAAGILYTPDAPDGISWRELVDPESGIGELLQQEKWQTYFSDRMTTNDEQEKQRILKGRGSDSVHQVSFAPLEGNTQDVMYNSAVGSQWAHADFRSVSNAEVRSQSLFNQVMFGIDVADLLLDIIPFRAGIGLARRAFKQAGGISSLAGITSSASGRRTLLPSVSAKRFAVPEGRLAGLAENGRGIFRDAQGAYFIRHEGVPLQVKGDFSIDEGTVEIINPRTGYGSGVHLTSDGSGGWLHARLSGGSGRGVKRKQSVEPGPSAAKSSRGSEADKFNVKGSNVSKKRTAIEEFRNEAKEKIDLNKKADAEIPILDPGDNNVRTLFNKIYEENNGIVFGEEHINMSAMKFMHDNVDNLYESGVRTLYVEIPRDHPYPGNKKMTYQEYYDEQFNKHTRNEKIAPVNSFTQEGVLNKFIEKGIKIECIDGSVARTSQIGAGSKTMDDLYINLQTEEGRKDRLIYMNYFAVNVMDHTKNDGKWCAWVGLKHMSESHGVPGLTKLNPSVGIELPSFNGDGDPTIIPNPTRLDASTGAGHFKISHYH